MAMYIEQVEMETESVSISRNGNLPLSNSHSIRYDVFASQYPDLPR